MSAYSELILSLSPTAYWRFGETSLSPATTYCLNSAYEGGMGWYGGYTSPTYHALGQPSLISEDSGNTSVEFLDPNYGNLTIYEPAGHGWRSAREFFKLVPGAEDPATTTLKAWSFAGWMKIPAFASGARVFFSSRYMMFCTVLPDRTIQLSWANTYGNWVHNITTATLPVDESAFVAITFDGTTTFKITINETTETFVPATAPLFQAASDYASIGGWDDNNGYTCKGVLDEFAFFPTQLTPAQISQIYATGTGSTITYADADLTATGTSAAEFVSNIVEFDATMAGSSDAVFVNPFVETRLVVQSTSTAAFAGATVVECAATMAGTSTATFVPPYLDIEAEMAGTSEASFVNATADFSMSAAGTSTAVFGGSYLKETAMFARGQSDARFVNAWGADTSMISHSKATAKFYDCSIYPSVLTCRGTSFARFRSEKVIERAVTFAGTSTARFDAAPNWDTAATMAGTSAAVFYNAFAEFDLTATGSSTAIFAGDKVPQAPTSRTTNLYVTVRPL